MPLSINKYAEGIITPRTRQVTNQLRNFPDAVNLTIGQPDFPTPNLVKQAGIQAIENDQTTYSPNAGLLSAREAVANFFQKQYNATYDPETEIIMTTGSRDRKSTRLNSSHVAISYAVFCLKKKKKNTRYKSSKNTAVSASRSE